MHTGLNAPAPAGPDAADGGPVDADAGPPERPATDSQLLRIGRVLGLRYGEAEAVLEALADTPPIRVAAVLAPASPLRARLGAFAPQLLAALHAVPGLFLVTDGVTPTRLERARDRARGALGAAARLGRLRAFAEAAAEREVGLLERAGQALHEAARDGRLGDAGAGLRELLRPLAALRRPRARRRQPVVH